MRSKGDTDLNVDILRIQISQLGFTVVINDPPGGDQGLSSVEILLRCRFEIAEGEFVIPCLEAFGENVPPPSVILGLVPRIHARS